jgi:hypothetical protein
MSDDLSKLLFENYERNTQMMALWEKHNFINDKTIIDVDFKFMISSTDVKNQFIDKFKESKVIINCQEFEFDSSAEYYITITLPNDTWNIDKLNATTTYFIKFTNSVCNSIIFEGVGAFIAKKKD